MIVYLFRAHVHTQSKNCKISTVTIAIIITSTFGGIFILGYLLVLINGTTLLTNATQFAGLFCLLYQINFIQNRISFHTLFQTSLVSLVINVLAKHSFYQREEQYKTKYILLLLLVL